MATRRRDRLVEHPDVVTADHLADVRGREARAPQKLHDERKVRVVGPDCLRLPEAGVIGAEPDVIYPQGLRRARHAVDVAGE
jgi:hypothetical protein